MEAKEYEWHKKRIGCISASELSQLMPGAKSDKWSQGNLTYLYKIQRQRTLNQPAPPVFSRTMQEGIEAEPYAVAWLRENTNLNILHCSEDLDEKVFTKTEWGLGCSPDCYIMSDDEAIESIMEIKAVIGESTTNFYFSPTVPYERKRLEAFDEHRDQLAGQLLCYPSISEIHLLKYDPQSDDDPFDLRSPLDVTRGIMFTFTREEFGIYLDQVQERVIFADNYLKSGKDLDSINTEWVDYKQQKQNSKNQSDNGTKDS